MIGEARAVEIKSGKEYPMVKITEDHMDRLMNDYSLMRGMPVVYHAGTTIRVWPKPNDLWEVRVSI